MSDPQRRLFAADLAPWEGDDRAERLVATVVFAEGPAGEFDYAVPDHLADEAEPGRRVRVPLGKRNRPITGYCVAAGVRPTDGRALKLIQAVLDRQSLLSPAMLRLTRWIAEYYLCEWGQVLEAVVPSSVRGGAGTRLVTILSVAPDAAAKIERQTLGKKQALVMRILAEAEEGLSPTELARLAKCTLAPITALRRKGLIAARSERVSSSRHVEPALKRQPNLALNADQQIALRAILESINSREHQTVLVHGVTGSGKTEVYIQAIQEVVGRGRQAIVLVPEISLTPQTVERFRRRFGRVAVLHSHLGDADRHWQWQRIANGEVCVVVGARSAIFAPTPRLGLIVLDEEHETSFKQDTAPRYHAREVAIQRAREEGVPLVLGSATPSLEAWHRAQTGQYRLVEMPRRVLDRPLPAVETVDLRIEAGSRHTRGAIHRQLHTAIRAALDCGGQVILLLNRRGFSTHIQCPACGHVVRCPDCDIALTHHRTEEIALCHYCGYQEAAPRACPSCQFAGISYTGFGTQRLEAEVRARFPDVRCLRMDTDTMQSPGSHERALACFRSGEVRILLGTQMIAKGLDFPNVTLVGVINADMALHLPDFRAAERTFQLVTQVAGRTGRGEKGGRVLVQTFNPDHPAIRAAARHDYRAFAAQELPLRQLLCYPPFSSMIRLVVRGRVENIAGQFAGELGQRLEAALERLQADARLLGPAPAPFSKLRGKYRFQIQLQAADGEKLRAAVREATAGLKPPDDVQWIVDVDPLDML
jgi:primosomal protein N' (replication factor Y)